MTGPPPTARARLLGQVGPGGGVEHGTGWEAEVLLSDWTRPSYLPMSRNSLNVLRAGRAIHLRCHRVCFKAVLGRVVGEALS